MPIVNKRKDVLDVYEDAADKGWVIPCFCTENLTTTEAIISAASEFAKDNHLVSVPVTLAMTINYEHRPQAKNYTHSRNSATGLELFKADAKALMREGGDFENVKLLLHLDHAQHDLDADLCAGDLSEYSSIMYDASTLPLEQNIEKTKAFVEKKKDEILIEGACDEIVDAGGSSHNDITSADKCEEYVRRTGVDLVVANLGTEHRASGKDLKYHGDAARAIKAKIGPKIVLHGTSSVTNDQVRSLFSDGVCKVNIWTALERDSSPELLDFLVKNISKAAGPKEVQELIEAGYLTKACDTGEPQALTASTTVARQDIIYKVMKQMVRDYLDMWYVL